MNDANILWMDDVWKHVVFSQPHQLVGKSPPTLSTTTADCWFPAAIFKARSLFAVALGELWLSQAMHQKARAFLGEG